jgi:hypothetical protein
MPCKREEKWTCLRKTSVNNWNVVSHDDFVWSCFRNPVVASQNDSFHIFEAWMKSWFCQHCRLRNPDCRRNWRTADLCTGTCGDSRAWEVKWESTWHWRLQIISRS